MLSKFSCHCCLRVCFWRFATLIKKSVFMCCFVSGVWEGVEWYLLSKSSWFHSSFLIHASAPSHHGLWPTSNFLHPFLIHPSNLVHTDSALLFYKLTLTVLALLKALEPTKVFPASGPFKYHSPPTRKSNLYFFLPSQRCLAWLHSQINGIIHFSLIKCGFSTS